MYAIGEKENPCNITILETYASHAAYEKHIASEHFQRYKLETLHMVKSLISVSYTHLAVGGTVLHRPGKYDNSRFINWSTPIEQGQSYHADHAVIDFQIPTKAHQMPLVFVHGYGQSGRCWQMTPDGREGFQTLMLRRGFSTYVVDMPGRGDAGRTSAETRLAPKARCV